MMFEIRSGRVTEQGSGVAAIAGVWQALVEESRSIGRQGGAVLEGRDIGAYVFPDAEKIFLTAQKLLACCKDLIGGELQIGESEGSKRLPLSE